MESVPRRVEEIQEKRVGGRGESNMEVTTDGSKVASNNPYGR